MTQRERGKEIISTFLESHHQHLPVVFSLFPSFQHPISWEQLSASSTHHTSEIECCKSSLKWTSQLSSSENLHNHVAGMYLALKLPCLHQHGLPFRSRQPSHLPRHLFCENTEHPQIPFRLPTTLRSFALESHYPIHHIRFRNARLSSPYLSRIAQARNIRSHLR